MTTAHNQSKRRGHWYGVKSSLHSLLYFIEKEILEPLMAHEYRKFRVAGFDQRLSQMDYDGGQITNNMELKIVDGHVFENRFQVTVYKLTCFLKRMRDRLDVSKDQYQQGVLP